MTAPATRRAALLLHALTAADRDWVLGALAPSRRAELQALMGELQELGIAPESEMVGRWLEPERHPLDDLGGRDLARLARTLAGEPPVLVARLLAARRWRWREALLARLPSAFAMQVRAASAAPRAPALERAMLQAAQALASARAERQAALPRLLQRLRGRA